MPAARRRSVPRRPAEAAPPDRFVGRERELAELGAGLDEVLSGHGRLFFFVGEPGIGKTRLAEEMGSVAAGRGARVLWGRAWESEGAPAYWPWIQILRGLVEKAAVEGLRAQIGGGLPYVAQLLPELEQVLPEAVEAAARVATLPPTLGPTRRRFHLFDALARFLVRAAADHPHVLVLDDLHWADVSSLLLLRFLAPEIRETPVLILGAYRDIEAQGVQPVGEILSSLAREGQVIHLGGLSESEVGRLVAAWDRERASDELVSNVYRTTEGNPFFVDGILRLLAARPKARPSVALPVPDEVRDSVRQRLAPLSEDLLRLLTVAAILGREFTHSALVAASGIDAENVISSIEAAQRLAILAGTPTPHRWRFAHDLFRDVLCADLPPTDRLELHERVGSALETFYGRAADEHASELASHFFSALPRGDARKAIRYGRLAARQAMTSYAWEEAVGGLDRVIAALELQPGTSRRERLDLLLELGEALWHGEDLTRHREVFEEALSLARELSLPQELGRAVLGLVGAGPPPGEVNDVKVALLEEALSIVDESDLSLRGRLLVQLAWQTYFSPDRDRRRTADECVRVARRTGEPTLLVEALRRRHTALLGSPRALSERVAVADEMLAVAQRTGNREGILVAALVRVINFLETGDVAALDTAIDAYTRGANEVREPFHLWFNTALRATRALMAGRWEEAERLSAEALSAGQAVQPTNATATYGVHQYQLHYEQGRIADLVPVLREYVQTSPKVPSWRAAMALACSDLGLTREARAEFDVLFATGIDELPVDYMLPAMLMQLSIVASFLGDVPRAEQLYTRLRDFSGQAIIIGYGAACAGAADRILGLLAGTLSRWDHAIRHFETALDMNRRMGMAPAVARTQYDYASTLLRRDEPGDAARAGALLREAIVAARDFGMARLLEQADETLGRIGAIPGKGTTADAPVTVAILRHEGDFWTIGWQGKSFRLRDLKGLTYIRRLVSEPGREFHCLDLLGANAVDLGDAGEVLDAEAKTAYRQRLKDLREELAEAESNDDTGRAAKAREEIELLGDELSSAVGLGGRDRRAARNVERVRIRVTRTIRDAITRIGRQDTSLGRHLSTAIRTGAFCSYAPDPTSPVTWKS